MYAGSVIKSRPVRCLRRRIGNRCPHQRQNYKRCWPSPGPFDDMAGPQYSVTLSDQADGYVIAGMIRLVPVEHDIDHCAHQLAGTETRDGHAGAP